MAVRKGSGRIALVTAYPLTDSAAVGNSPNVRGQSNGRPSHAGEGVRFGFQSSVKPHLTVRYAHLTQPCQACDTNFTRFDPREVVKFGLI